MVIIVVFIVILRRLCVFPLYYTHTFCFISFLLVVFVVGTATAIQPHTAHSVSMLLLFSMYTYKLNLLFSIILYQTFVPRIRHISCFFFVSTSLFSFIVWTERVVFVFVFIFFVVIVFSFAIRFSACAFSPISIFSPVFWNTVCVCMFLYMWWWCFCLSARVYIIDKDEKVIQRSLLLWWTRETHTRRAQQKN